MKTPSDFWKIVEKGPVCWLFKPRSKSYYGYFKGKVAHRYSWALANGPIPKGMFVLHKCDVPHCVRPDHLFLGTASDNSLDAHRKQRLGSRGIPKGMTKEDIEKYCTMSESLDMLAEKGISRTIQWLKGMIVSGHFKTIKFGRSPLIPKEEIRKFATEELKRRAEYERRKR